MQQIPIATLIAKQSLQYEKRLTGTPLDIREYIALLDYYIRITATITSAVHKSIYNNGIKLSNVPGVGEMVGCISKIKSIPENLLITDLLKKWKIFSMNFLTEITKNIFEGTNFKIIRDKFSHGHPLPANDTQATALMAAIKELNTTLRQIISRDLCDFQVKLEKSSIAIECNLISINLSPLWDGAKGFSIGIYSAEGYDGIYYLSPEEGLYLNTDGANKADLCSFYLKDRSFAQTYGRFIFDITRDITSFNKRRSPPIHYIDDGENSGVLFVSWTHTTSENTSPRTDLFRIGRDNRYEWNKSGEDWIGYSEFLKFISNWNTLSERLRDNLEDQFSSHLRQNSLDEGIPIFRPNLSEKEDSTDVPQEIIISEETLTKRILSSGEKLNEMTEVFFLVGDAGMGKTELLLNIARSCSVLPDVPLFVYVTSTGRALSNIDDAISSTLASTKIIDSFTAKTLCRNGLLIIIIDGFDELLGGGSYDDPLASLSSWFKELSGRGTLVASARSSYYMTRYKRALSVYSKAPHSIINVKPWEKETAKIFLTQCGVDEKRISDLHNNDWKLLSIPFFARTYASWCAKNKQGYLTGKSRIFDIVINQYINRESKKLENQNGMSVIPLSDLQNLFCEISDLMHANRTYEVTQSDLEMCAEITLESNNLAIEHPGVKNRLSSLCGISVDSSVSGLNKFTFTHEVIFDSFLALLLEKKCDPEINIDFFKRFMNGADVQPAVWDWFIEKNQLPAQYILEKIVEQRYDTQSWKNNVGGFWTSLINHNGGIPPTSKLRDIPLGKCSFNKASRDIAVNNCSVDEMRIFNGWTNKIELTGTEINYLWLESLDLINLLSGVKPENIKAIEVKQLFYHDNTASIRKLFVENNIIKSTSDSDKKERQERQDITRYFLTTYYEKPWGIVIDSVTYEPDGPQFNWATRYGLSYWRNFISALVRNKLAELEPMNTKGANKLRLSFIVNPSSILKGDPEKSIIKEFWDAI